MAFVKGAQYSRNDVWKVYHPGHDTKPKGGNWDTGWVTEGSDLIAFLNIDSAGRTGHDFDNSYDAEREVLIWYGKPETHSGQPLIKRMISGDLNLHFFARWHNKNVRFQYLGEGVILGFEDRQEISNGKTAIKFEVLLATDKSTIGAEGIPDVAEKLPEFAKRKTLIVNKWERDLSKRQACVEHFGYSCQICGFSFEEVYGEIGRDFCHVHHIEPLGEVGGEKNIDPIKDLIPLCANCHAVIHRQTPALSPDEVKRFISDKY